MITREETIKTYMMSTKLTIAGMLYDTITRYEERIKELESKITNNIDSCTGCEYEYNKFYESPCDTCSCNYKLKGKR